MEYIHDTEIGKKVKGWRDTVKRDGAEATDSETKETTAEGETRQTGNEAADVRPTAEEAETSDAATETTDETFRTDGEETDDAENGQTDTKSEARETYERVVSKYGENASSKIDITVKDREATAEKARKVLAKRRECSIVMAWATSVWCMETTREGCGTWCCAM